MFSWLNWSTVLDVALIIVPFIILIVVILKFVVPKKPALGIGLAIGGGLLGAWLVNRRLKSAFDVEKKLAEHNAMMAAFKARQKERAQAVIANQQVIKILEKQREKLSEEADRHETELKLLDRELEDRRQLNKKIVSESSDFLAESETNSAKRKALLQGYLSSNGTKKPAIIVHTNGEASVIEVNGYHLFRIN